MGLLGKLFGGSGKKKSDGASSRSKRGRAPSIRQIPAESADDDAAPLPEISLDDIEQQTASGGAPAAPTPVEPVPIDMDMPAAPAAPAAPQAPAAPKPAARKPAAAAPAGGRSTRRMPAPASPPRASRRSTRMQSRQKPIGEILIQAEAVSTEQLSRALKIQDKGNKGLLGQILVKMGACDPTAISKALGRQFRISTVELDRVEVPGDVAALVPEETCREQRLIPFEKLGKMLCLAMANCLNRKAINEIEEKTKLKVKPFNCSWIEIREAIERVYSQDGVRQAAAAADAAAGQEAATAQAEAVAKDLEAETDTVKAGADSPEDELRPFSGPAKAVIEGLEDLDAEAEVVETTERGLASRHLAARQARREERAKVMGRGKGVVGKLIAPDLDKFFGGEPDVIDLREASEDEIRGAELPVALDLAESVSAFAEKTAEAVAEQETKAEPEPQPAPVVEAEPVAELEPEMEELVPVHGGDADHDSTPQVATVAAAEVVADELPAPAKIAPVAEEPKEADALAISDQEWASMEADLEPDPVVLWEAAYASEGPVPVRESLI